MGLFGSKSDDNSKDVFSRLGKEVKEDMMVNTLEDNDLAKLAAGMKSELTGSESRESITDKLEAELNNESEAIETVSYTHLDVYKRQVFIFAVCFCIKNACNYLMVLI